MAKVRTAGSPGDILDLILADEAATNSDLAKLLTEKIRSATKIMLAGCIDAVSAAGMIHKLQGCGFTGELDIYDLSGAPLAIIDAYKKAGFWPGISVNTRQVDLFGVSLGHERCFDTFNPRDKGFDLIFVDILGHYLTDEQFHWLPILAKALAESGIILMRDMAEDGEVDIEKQTLRKNHESFDEDESKFSIWLADVFGFHVTVEQIHSMRVNRFNNPPQHGYRQLVLSGWVEFLFRQSELLYRGWTVPSTGDDSRIFPIFAIGKERRLNNISPHKFLYNSNGTSMARDMRDYG